MPRCDLAWQPISQARKRKLKKRGITCKWSRELQSWVRQRPGTIYQVLVCGQVIGTTTGLRINPRRRNRSKLDHLRELIAHAVERQRTITVTL